MDPRDRLIELLGGTGCAACGGRVPTEGVRVLAQRDELAFAELSCPGCGSVALAIVVASDDERLVDGPAHLELSPAEEARFADAAPIGHDDVVAMREFLADWHGDLRSLLEPRSPGSSA